MQSEKLIVKIVLIALLTNGISSVVLSQHLLGITTSNYAGSTGTLLNPASLLSSKLYQDINLITFDAYINNNYLYLHGKDYNFFKLAGNQEFPKYGPDDMPFDAYADKIPKTAFIQTLVRGPAMFQARGWWAYSFYTGFRVVSSVQNVPYDVANFLYYGMDHKPQHNINYSGNNYYTNALGFFEIGGTYARSVINFGFDDVIFGATVKALLGHSGAYAYVEDMNYMVLNDSTINIKNLNATAGYSIPLDYQTNDYTGGMVRGFGGGVDLGFIYQRRVRPFHQKRYLELCHQEYVDYYYKFGISLIDLGLVNFSNNAELHSFDNVSKYWYGVDTLSYYNINRLTHELSNVFYGDPEASYRGDKITVFLPASLALTADYHYSRNIYLNLAYVQPLVFNKSTVARPTTVSLTPRYETPNFEFSIPMTLYDWRYPQFGAAVRFEFLTIGTEKLGSIIGLTDFTGLDVYASIKLNFSRGNCGFWNKFEPCSNGEYGLFRGNRKLHKEIEKTDDW